MKNRYDSLMAQATKIRNKIYNKTTATNVQVERLKTQIAKIQNDKRVYCEKLTNQLIDVNSLIANEQRRIMKDAQEFGTTLEEGGNK